MDYLKSRNENIVDFDKHYKDDLSNLERDIEKITNMYIFLLSKNHTYCLKEKSEYLILILRSVDYLISATSLARQRAFIEAGNIVRLCIETSSMAIHIHSDDFVFSNYKQNKYKSTDAISFAQKQIKIIGVIWGTLSQLAIHPNTYHGLSSELIDGYIYETGTVNLGFKQKNEIQDKQMIILLRITANIIYKCFQLIFSKQGKLKGVDGLYYENFDFFALEKSTDIIIDELFSQFKK